MLESRKSKTTSKMDKHVDAGSSKWKFKFLIVYWRKREEYKKTVFDTYSILIL